MKISSPYLILFAIFALVGLASSCTEEEGSQGNNATQNQVENEDDAGFFDAGDTGADVDDDNATHIPLVRDHMGPIGGDRAVQAIFPEGYDVEGNHPLLFLLHGYSSNAIDTRAFFNVGAEADRHGIVVLAPEGTRDTQNNRFWNATIACCDWFQTGVDDATYLSELIDEAVERHAIDPERIYFMGISNGGFMSHRMACDYGDKIRGIVSFNGSSTQHAQDCDPEHPVEIIHVHGTADTTVTYEGTSAYPGAQEVADWWADWNQCDDEPLDGPDIEVTTSIAGEETSTLIWQNCDEGGAVQLWTMHDAPHVPFPLANFAELVFDVFLAP